MCHFLMIKTNLTFNVSAIKVFKVFFSVHGIERERESLFPVNTNQIPECHGTVYRAVKSHTKQP